MKTYYEYICIVNISNIATYYEKVIAEDEENAINIFEDWVSKQEKNICFSSELYEISCFKYEELTCININDYKEKPHKNKYKEALKNMSKEDIMKFEELLED